jgi:hypothetical protein
MNKLFLSCVAALLLSAGGALANAYARWTDPHVPTSVEVIPVFNGSKIETSSYFVVYLNDVPYAAPLNSDKARGMLELVRSAFIHGRKINIYWDETFRPTVYYCDNWDQNGNCVSAGSTQYNRIQKISLQ